MSEHWRDTYFSYIWIFNVGRGLSIFIRTALNHGIIYDFGSSEDFSPIEFIEDNIIPYLYEYKGKKIAQTIISHPHLDHISEIESLIDSDSPFNAVLHTCPHDKYDEDYPDERIDWERVNNPTGSEEKIKIYRSLYEDEKRELPLQTIQYDSEHSVPDLEYGIYYIRPPTLNDLFPKDDQNYTNGTSLVFFFRHGLHTLLIPGDIPPSAMDFLLKERSGCEKRYTIFSRIESQNHPDWHIETSDQPSLKGCLQQQGLSILVAPHHGLESGYSETLYNSILGGKPQLVIISEKRHLSPSDGQVDERYQTEEGAEGISINIEGTIRSRYSISTRNGHNILIIFKGTSGSPKVFAEREPEKLLDKV